MSNTISCRPIDKEKLHEAKFLSFFIPVLNRSTHLFYTDCNGETVTVIKLVVVH